MFNKTGLLVKKALQGDTFSLSRVISMVERRSCETPNIMKFVHPLTGRAHRVGITGPSGVGKSTIIDDLIVSIRNSGQTAGVVAVDPTSPFTGGALLGDRIRMRQHYLDEGVYIRSMGTRFANDGLPETIGYVVNLIDASGKHIIIIETVGVGQIEVGIMKNTDTIIVALSPEGGDSIQAMKAGLLEIADIFVVNKIDRPGADISIESIKGSITLKERDNGWDIPVIGVNAVEGTGIGELHRQIGRHYQFLKETGRLTSRRREQCQERLADMVVQRFTQRVRKTIGNSGHLKNYIEQIENGEIDPFSAAEKVIGSDDFLLDLSKSLSSEEDCLAEHHIMADVT